MATQVTATANAQRGSSFLQTAIALQTLTIFSASRTSRRSISPWVS